MKSCSLEAILTQPTYNNNIDKKLGPIQDVKDTTSEDLFQLHKTLQYELNDALVSSTAAKRQVNLFEAVVDPSSFTQTVENMFALTFLVKDNQAWVKIKDDIPVVEAKTQVSSQESREDRQCIVSLNQADFEELSKRFSLNNTSVLLKHRTGDIYDDAQE